MDRDPYLDLIAGVGRWRPPIFTFGGLAEDAVLYGSISRPHADLDVLVERSELSSRLAAAEALGFTEFEVYYQPLPGQMVVLNAEHNGVHLEVSIFDRDTDGRLYAVILGGEDETPYRIYLPGDALTFPPARIEGIPIQTVSPLALYQIRAGLVIIDAFGGPRPSDLLAQERLLAKFFPGKTTDELGPEVQRHTK